MGNGVLTNAAFNYAPPCDAAYQRADYMFVDGNTNRHQSLVTQLQALVQTVAWGDDPYLVKDLLE